MGDIVREMMKQQHKAMFIALRDGKFDPVVEGNADASQATKAVAGESPPSIPPGPSIVGPLPGSLTPPPALTPTGALRPTASATPTVPTASNPVMTEDTAPATIRQPTPVAELTLDIAALERAAVASSASPPLHGTSDLPPPPANLFREKTSGKYRMTPVPPQAAVSPPQAPPRPNPAGGAPPTPPRRGGTPPAPPGERRYAPTRPAAIFGQARPQQGKSIFGEDLISDKSLDEVILSYLAEDLEEKK
jgi:hypothetical protein